MGGAGGLQVLAHEGAGEGASKGVYAYRGAARGGSLAIVAGAAL